MRFKHRFANVGSESTVKKSKKIRKILDKYLITYEYKEEDTVLGLDWSLVFYLYEDMDSYAKIIEEIIPFNLIEITTTEFDKNEIDNAEWYEIFAPPCQYPQPEDGYEELVFNTNDRCPICGFGKMQINPYQLKKRPKQKGNQFWGIFWEQDALFCSSEIKNLLERESIKGIHFIQPVLKGNIPIEGYYQIIIETTLEKGFNPKNTTERICRYKKDNWRPDGLDTKNLKYCGKMQYDYPRKGGYTFSRKIFYDNIDFCRSKEYFENGERVNMISKKVYETIVKNKLKGLIIEPIFYI